MSPADRGGSAVPEIYVQRMSRRRVHVVDASHPRYQESPEAATFVFSSMRAAETFAGCMSPHYWVKNRRGWRLALMAARRGMVAGIVSLGQDGFAVYDGATRRCVAAGVPTLDAAKEVACSLLPGAGGES